MTDTTIHDPSTPGGDPSTVVVLSPEMVAEAVELAGLRRTIASLQKREKLIRNRIIDALDAAGAVTGIDEHGNRAAVVTTSLARRIDRHALEARYPTIYAEVGTTSMTRKLMVDLPVKPPTI